MVHAPDLIKIIETSILTFQLFVKMDKKKTSSVLNLFGNQNQAATPLQQIQSSLEKVKFAGVFFHLDIFIQVITKSCKKSGLRKFIAC